MAFIFNPDAEEFIPKAEEEHHHSGERYGYSLGEERLDIAWVSNCLLYTSPSPRDRQKSRMPSSA